MIMIKIKKTAVYKNKLLLILFVIVPINLFCQFQFFAESYNLLSTVAGKGEKDIDGEVGWLPEFENGQATEAELTRPHIAMADTSGNIYIADKDAHGIRKVTPEGIIYTIAGTNMPGDGTNAFGTECQLNAPNGIWVKEDGTVYILDFGNIQNNCLDTWNKYECTSW